MTADRAGAVATSGALRLVRGTAVGLTATGLALAGHVAAGGWAPPPATALLLLVAAVAVATALSGRRWTLAPLLVVLLGTQVVFHVVFGSHHHHHGGGSPLPMAAAHVLAALTAAVLLRRGESWCWGLLALLVAPLRTVAALGGLVRVADLPVLRLDTQAGSIRSSRLLAFVRPLRGPPVPVR